MAIVNCAHLSFSDLEDCEVQSVLAFRRWLDLGHLDIKSQHSLRRILCQGAEKQALDVMVAGFHEARMARPDFRGYGTALTIQEEHLLDFLARHFDVIRASQVINRNGSYAADYDVQPSLKTRRSQVAIEQPLSLESA